MVLLGRFRFCFTLGLSGVAAPVPVHLCSAGFLLYLLRSDVLVSSVSLYQSHPSALISYLGRVLLYQTGNYHRVVRVKQRAMAKSCADLLYREQSPILGVQDSWNRGRVLRTQCSLVCEQRGAHLRQAASRQMVLVEEIAEFRDWQSPHTRRRSQTPRDAPAVAVAKPSARYHNPGRCAPRNPLAIVTPPGGCGVLVCFAWTPCAVCSHPFDWLQASRPTKRAARRPLPEKTKGQAMALKAGKDAAAVSNG